MDETADPAPAGGGKQIGRPCDIARLEPGAVGCIDYACDVDDRVGPVAKPVEAGRIFQRSGDPLYAIAWALFAAGERAYFVASINSAI